jgi:transcriptional regulator with XRE-family HTH domain
MSQEDLADRLTQITGDKWTRNMVASLENGRRSFDVDLLGPIAEATGVTVEFLAIGPAESNFLNPGYDNWDPDQLVIPWDDYVSPSLAPAA